MNRRVFLSSLLVAPVLFAADKPTSSKKGWAGADRKMHERFRVSWWYNWTTQKQDDPAFVPCVKGAGAVDKAAAALKQGGSLLGFNEPERESQGNVSVDEAIKLWPRLVEAAKAKGCRIGSPAPSSDQGGMDWLKKFMDRARREKLQVDFVALHWYRGRNAGAFTAWLQEMKQAYRRPLWITEFNGWDGPAHENEIFLRTVLRTMERDRDVERYAYFNTKAGHPCSLVKADGSLTSLGKLYEEI